jgi:glutaredoxin 3
MYTTRWCGYCSAARKLLQSKSVPFEEIDVGLDSKLRKEMTELSGRRTVPQIFIAGQAVGGYDDIAALDADGSLDTLLGLNGDDGN